MKKIIGAILGLCICVSGWSQNAGELVLPLTDPAKRSKVKVEVKYGSITVKGTARKDILIKYASVADDEPEVRAVNKSGLKKIGGGTMDLEMVENANLVRIESGSWSKKINLVVEVPTEADLIVSGYNDSDLVIDNVKGTIELESYNGEINATNISGAVVATTYNGDVKITFDKVTEGTPMSFSTYNGDIDLTFPVTLKASLKMKTEQGEVFSDFEMKVLQSGPVQKKDNKAGVTKIVVDEWVKGEINGGGPEFTMMNYNGDIIVRKKQ